MIGGADGPVTRTPPLRTLPGSQVVPALRKDFSRGQGAVDFNE
jgi:hypothetical protein